MQAVTTIGLDIAKSVFQVHGVDAEGKVLIRRKLKRRYVLEPYVKRQKNDATDAEAICEAVTRANMRFVERVLNSCSQPLPMQETSGCLSSPGAVLQPSAPSCGC